MRTLVAVLPLLLFFGCSAREPWKSSVSHLRKGVVHSFVTKVESNSNIRGICVTVDGVTGPVTPAASVEETTLSGAPQQANFTQIGENTWQCKLPDVSIDRKALHVTVNIPNHNILMSRSPDASFRIKVAPIEDDGLAAIYAESPRNLGVTPVHAPTPKGQNFAENARINLTGQERENFYDYSNYELERARRAGFRLGQRTYRQDMTPQSMHQQK